MGECHSSGRRILLLLNVTSVLLYPLSEEFEGRGRRHLGGRGAGPEEDLVSLAVEIPVPVPLS